MSLDAIRAMRRSGFKPALVWVVLGDRPQPLSDDTKAVIVRPSDEPRLMDWRPLIGVLVVVLVTAPQPERALAMLEALQRAGAKLCGTVDATGTLPTVIAGDEECDRLLRRGWELLCR